MIKMRLNRWGDQIWENKSGEFHREDGPAYIWHDGGSDWYINGIWHRQDGPARIFDDLSEKWYVNGECITDQVLVWMVEMSINSDYTKWTDKEKMWFKLQFCGN